MLTVWLVVFVAALLLELCTPSALVSVWLAVGALFGAGCALLGFNVVVQVVVFVLVSMAFIVIARPFAIRYLRGNVVATNADRLIGEIALVVESIEEDAWGAVKIHGVEWSAIATDHSVIQSGEHVRVDAIEGAKLLVHKVEQ